MPFIHIIRLRQLQSKIQHTVFRVDLGHDRFSSEHQARVDVKVEKIRLELDRWVNTIPNPPPNVESPTWMYQPENIYHDSLDFFTLQYHKTVLSLYTALLPSLPASDSRFISCAQSSARICSTYKRLNHQKILSFTIIGLHSCFVAGLTLIYCLWRDRTLFSFDILEATRACSQCLTIFGEKWPGAVKYGQIFESLSSCVLKAVMEPSQNSDSRPDLSTTFTSDDFADSNRGVDTGTTDPLLGAVKDVYMEVDEEVPGGWQGWRMFNEMVQSQIQVPEDGELDWSTTATTHQEQFSTQNWNTAYNPEYGNIEMGPPTFGANGGWGHGFFAGYD